MKYLIVFLMLIGCYAISPKANSESPIKIDQIHTDKSTIISKSTEFGRVYFVEMVNTFQ